MSEPVSGGSSGGAAAHGGAPRIRRRSVEAAIVAATQIAAIGLTFGIGVVTARIFAPEVRGEYGLFVTVVAFASVLTTFGLPEAIVYFHRRGEADHASVATSIALSVASAAAVLLLASPLAPWFAGRFFPTGGPQLVAVAVAAGLATVLLRNATAFLQSRHQFLESGLYNLARPILFGLSLVWVWWASLGLVATGWLYFAAAAIAACLAFAPLARRIRPSALRRDYVSRLLRFSAKSYAQAIVNQLNYRVDMFVVAYLVSDFADVAFYHVATNIASLLWVAPDSYGAVIYPRLAAHNDERARTHEAVLGMRYVFAVVASGAALLALVAGALVPLIFGEEYAASTPLLLALLPGVVAMGISKILMRYFLSRNRHQLNTIWILIAVSADVVANILLIPRHGILGASLAASLAYVGMAAGMLAAFVADADVRAEDLRDFPRREIRLAWSTVREGLARLRSRNPA